MWDPFSCLPGSKLNSKSTADDVLRGVDLSGMTAVITGANAGLGAETARALAHAGATCLLCCRSMEAGQRMVETLQRTVTKGRIVVMLLDLADLGSISRLATDVSANYPKIDMLILNAGVMALRPKDGQPQRTREGFEMQFGTNHLGHAYLVKLLLPKLKAQGSPARIVVLSSSAYRWGRIHLEDPNYQRRRYAPWDAYNQSKLANRLFTHELARRLRQERSGVEVFSVHPGIIRTNIGNHIGPRASCFYALAGPFMKSLGQGAATTVYAATAGELAGKSGAHLAGCRVVRPARRGRDDAVAADLWRKTEELLVASQQPTSMLAA